MTLQMKKQYSRILELKKKKKKPEMKNSTNGSDS